MLNRKSDEYFLRIGRIINGKDNTVAEIGPK
jgi:hypothetical protein